MAKSPTAKLLVSFRPMDSKFGVSRKTVQKMAGALGLTDTETTLLALARLRDSLLPAYEADDGPLTNKQVAAIRKLERQDLQPTRSLFEGA
jgi:hypothetical protein